MKFRLTFLTLAAAALAIPASTLAGPPAHAKGGPPAQETIVDVAVATRDALNGLGEDAPFTINTIVGVVAGDPALLDALTRRGQRTVFAPTDEAFANLEATLNTLCLSIGDLSMEQVRTVVSYHVLNGRRDSGEVLGSDQLRTINGGFLWQSGGTLTDAVGRDANIIYVDVEADNGIIHVIDEVVLPFVPPSNC